MAEHSKKLDQVSIESTVSAVRELIADAESDVAWVARSSQRGGMDAEDAVVVNYAHRSIATAFTQLMMLADALGLSRTYKRVRKSYRKANKNVDGLCAHETYPDGDVHLTVASVVRRFASSLEAVFGLKSLHVVSKDVIDVLRATQYAITDRNCFANPPATESDVHHRVEAVLKCVFPKLRHKPPVPKAIKNFEPDTGLPSMRTLVEYKFIQSKSEIGRIADEILADTRGYQSGDWDNFVFLIYETCRLRPEEEWNDLLRECGTALNTQVIVICGEAPESKQPVPKKKAARES